MPTTMIDTLAVSGYRSVRELVLGLEGCNLVTGANGAGKSNLYRALRLLHDASFGRATQALAREGGLDSVLWAGPESPATLKKRGQRAQGGPRSKPVALRLGFAGEGYGYAIDIGLPVPVPRTMFIRDPEIKSEVVWYGDTFEPRRVLAERRDSLVRVRDEDGQWQIVEQHLPGFESMLTRVADGHLAPEVLLLRQSLQAWRFYDHFRCDADAPARLPQVGVRTTVLAADGHDLAAAWRTIEEIGDQDGLHEALDDAFPGTRIDVLEAAGRFELVLHQPGLLRPLSQAEVSDGTLRYLLTLTALLTPRPPPLMVLNEPESSLHPDLLPALARLMAAYAERAPLWVVSHSETLVQALTAATAVNRIELSKEGGETVVPGRGLLDGPAWRWPSR